MLKMEVVALDSYRKVWRVKIRWREEVETSSGEVGGADPS
jgi:hypothetical protein